MRLRQAGALAVAIGSLMFTLACAQSTTAPTVASVSVIGSTVAVGQSTQLTAMAVLSVAGAGTQDITLQAIWQSADHSIATVSAAGVVTGVAHGATTVTASYEGETGSAQITVTP